MRKGFFVLGAVLCAVLAGCGSISHGSGAGANLVASTPLPSPSPSASLSTVAAAAGQDRHGLGMPTVDPGCRSAIAVDIAPGRPPETKLPNYGFGTGPAYLSGQVIPSPDGAHAVWFAAGQYADIVVAPSFTGAVTVSGHRIGGSGAVHFGGNSSAVVAPRPPQSYWRYWSGQLTFDSVGCYQLDLSGSGMATEHVVVQAAAGQPGP